MTPINDPRPFASVLADWLASRGLTTYSAAGRLLVTAPAIRKWLRAAPCPHERAYRALMTLIDEGRA